MVLILSILPLRSVLGLEYIPSEKPIVILLSDVAITQLTLFLRNPSSIYRSCAKKLFMFSKADIFLLTEPFTLFSLWFFFEKSKSFSVRVSLKHFSKKSEGVRFVWTPTKCK